MRVQLLGPNSVRVEPPAKLNLFLEVLRKREDGYHEIETVMQAISLCDVLDVTRTPGNEITIAKAGRYPAPADRSNLAVKAAEAFFSTVGHRFGLKLFLTKNIPAGAGLGGGSSDAAGALAALNHLAGLPMTPAALSELAGTIGSDVPFFLDGGAAIGRGRGELVEPLVDSAIPDSWFVVMFPGVLSPTPLIYKSLMLDLTTCKRNLHRFLDDLSRASRARDFPFFNALATPFRAVFPALGKLQDEISRATGHAFHVSGSGSAMYAAVDSPAEGTEVESVLQAMAAGDTFLVRNLPRRSAST